MAKRVDRVHVQLGRDGVDFAGPQSLSDERRILIVDLNVFANFPTLAVGLLAASLRAAGRNVSILSPLAFDAPASERERRENLLDHLARLMHLTDFGPALRARDAMRQIRLGWIERPNSITRQAVIDALDQRPSIVLLSAYFNQFRAVEDIAAEARKRGIPVLVGGPMFNQGAVLDKWRQISGLVGIVGAEVDLSIGDIVDAAMSGEDLSRFPGVTLPDGKRAPPAPPLRHLDHTPIPDFRDFPWDRYPNRIVPVMTGRGCQWDKCAFCSDVISVSGRTFRTRSVENVLLEIQEQARRHNSTNFLFLDLKLNSWPDMLRGISQNIQKYVQGAEWVGTVHVDQRKDNGLSARDLKAAVDGGMRRISFGLESGSQRILDAANKGCTVEANRQFIRDAHQAGLSVRATMFKGFPGETAEDMEETANFLEENAAYLDRVRFNDFSLLPDTPIWNDVRNSRTPLDIIRLDTQRGRAIYRNRDARSKDYRRAKRRALNAVYAINKRPLRDAARQFDGLM
ncbi:B12-binding domain-containing radical SAM protein [Erythrobacter aurantius]|uniref:B12-binding domain-containing radical SAM protein n=1 Tax=Erythrobacter aurantius TaxID=2909249 RepID=UPI00207AE03D|nr:radical SAM protein [Erythrobacter aurantius]